MYPEPDRLVITVLIQMLVFLQIVPGLYSSTNLRLPSSVVLGVRSFSSKRDSNVSRGSYDKKIKRLKDKEKELTLLLKKKENEKKRLLQLREEAEIMLKLAKTESNKIKKVNKGKKSSVPLDDNKGKKPSVPLDDKKPSVPLDDSKPTENTSDGLNPSSETPPSSMQSKLLSFFPSISLPVPESNKPVDPTPDSPSSSPSKPDLPQQNPLSQQSDSRPSGSPSELPPSEPPLPSTSSMPTGLQQQHFTGLMRYVLILLASLSPIGLMVRIHHLNSSILDGSRLFMDKIINYSIDSRVFISSIAALALTYALNYRKMKNPKDIAKLFLQLLIIIPLILVLCDVFDVFQIFQVDSDIASKQVDTAVAVDTDKSDGPGPLTQPNAWCYSKKV